MMVEGSKPAGKEDCNDDTIGVDASSRMNRGGGGNETSLFVRLTDSLKLRVGRRVVFKAVRDRSLVTFRFTLVLLTLVTAHPTVPFKSKSSIMEANIGQTM